MSRLALPLAVFLLLPGAAGADDSRTPSGDKPASDGRDRCEKRVRAMAPFPNKDGVLNALDKLEEEASAQPQERRERHIAAGLGASNAEARRAVESADPRVAAELGNAFARMNNDAGNWKEGRDFADAVLKRAPADRDALISRSQANSGLRRFDEAFADADRAAKLAPDSADAYRARAMALYGQGRYLEAIEDARKTLALNPNDRTAFAVMKLAESRVPALSVEKLGSQMVGEVQREYHGMVQQIAQAEEKRLSPHPEDMPADEARRVAARLVRNAASKLALKDYAGTLEDTSRALEHDAQNAAAYYYRAAAQNLLGRYEEAAADATRALLLAPGDLAARDARAWAYNHLGRMRDAIADAHHSLEINPHNPYAYANLGYANEQLGDLNSMLRHLRTAAALNPQFEPAYRDAAARHGLEAASPALGESPKAQREKARRRSFSVVLASSAVGGLLIALGFLQLSASNPQRGRPQRIGGDFVLGRQIGGGGMGLIYEAEDTALRRKVAVKVMREELRTDARAKERFMEEARTVAALHHPHIVDIHSIVDDASGLYLIFELVTGKTVADLLAQRGRLSLAEARSILKPVCAALDFAHRREVVHRDLKPANIMITDAGDAKVMDFGISRHAQAARPTNAGETQATARGTPYYMAPEQEYGAVRKESDIYSLGACLYEMLAGRPPYCGQATAEQKMRRDYPKLTTLVPELPAAIDQLIDWSLEPDPDKRVRSVRDFWALLDRIRVAQPV